MTVEEIRTLYEMPGTPDHWFGRQSVGVLLVEIGRLKEQLRKRPRFRRRPRVKGPTLFDPSREKP